jgi:hypothetical protein
MKNSELFAGLKPYIVELIRSTSLVAGAGTGTTGTGMQVHALDSSWHTGQLDPSQATWALSSYRTVAAGAGLTGGGNLTADISLDVAAGNGIEVTGDAVHVKLKTTSGLELDANGVSMVAPATLTVATTNSLANHTHAITSSAAPGAAASLLATDADGLLTLTTFKIGTAAIAFNSTNNIATAPDIQFGTNALLAAESSMYFNIDSDNGTTNAFFRWGTDAATSAATELMRLTETGRLGIGDTTPSYELDVAGSGQFQTSVLTPTITTASGILTISPVGDLTLYPGGGDVLPGSSALIDLGHYNRKYRTLYAQELYVETLVAQDVLATIGGRIEVTPTTTLIADLAAGDSTIDVKHNNLRNGEFAYLMAAPAGVAQFEVIKVDSAASSITGGYRYTILRNRDGSGANDWVAGDAVASMGLNNGDGFISLTATSTILSHLGPTMTVYSRSGTSWNSLKATTATGNLESFVDYSAPEFGFAVGNDLTLDAATGFKGLTADRTNGLRLFSTDLSFYSGATQTGNIASAGTLWFGPSSSDKRLEWNGTTLSISGSITATTGNIAGWAITATQIENVAAAPWIRLISGGAGTARLEVGNSSYADRGAGIVSRSTLAGIVFYAGKDFANIATAPFQVNMQGDLIASQATLTGSLTAGNVAINSTNAIKITATSVYDLNRSINWYVSTTQIGYINVYGTGASDGVMTLTAGASVFLNTANVTSTATTVTLTDAAVEVLRIKASGATGYLRASDDSNRLSWTNAGVSVTGTFAVSSTSTFTGAVTAPSVRAASGTLNLGIGTSNYLTVAAAKTDVASTQFGSDWSTNISLAGSGTVGDWVSGYEGRLKRVADLVWFQGRFDPVNSTTSGLFTRIGTIATAAFIPARDVAYSVIGYYDRGGTNQGYEFGRCHVYTSGEIHLTVPGVWRDYQWIDVTFCWSVQ